MVPVAEAEEAEKRTTRLRPKQQKAMRQKAHQPPSLHSRPTQECTVCRQCSRQCPRHGSTQGLARGADVLPSSIVSRRVCICVVWWGKRDLNKSGPLTTIQECAMLRRVWGRRHTTRDQDASSKVASAIHGGGRGSIANVSSDSRDRQLEATQQLHVVQ